MCFLEKAYPSRNLDLAETSATNCIIPLTPLYSPDFSESPGILFEVFRPQEPKSQLCSFVPSSWTA